MQNSIISSAQNAVIKLIGQLQSKKSARVKEKLFIVEGIRAVKEIPSHYKVKYYVTTPALSKEELPQLDSKKHIVVTEELYRSISDTKTPQGVMAIAEIPGTELTDLCLSQEGIYLVLENIQDPGNLGTIIRTAHAFGVKHIFITKGSVDVYSPKVVRAAMGSLFHITVCIGYEIEDYINVLKKDQVTIYVTDLEEAQPVFDITFKRPLAIVIGNEGNGISEYVRNAADYKMMIPMPGGSESLNASVAASICIYELMRQCYLNQ